MSQLSFPDADEPQRGRLDPQSEAFLEQYVLRYQRDRSVDTVRGERSQLRTVAREAQRNGSNGGLGQILSDPAVLARVLTSPAKPLSASTAFIRLGAINAALLLRFGDQEGQRRIDALDASLPKRTGTDWWESGVVLAGHPSRRRAQSPTIEPADLAVIVARAGDGKRHIRVVRDRALVATHCFSGLRTGEIRTLRWDQLVWEPGAESYAVRLPRQGVQVKLPIFGPAAALLARWRLLTTAQTYVFSNPSGEPFTRRQVRRIVQSACQSAGFGNADSATLTSAAAAYLSSFGVRDHEIAMALGIRDMRTVNRLLRPHQRLQAQRSVRDGSPARLAGDTSITSLDTMLG